MPDTKISALSAAVTIAGDEAVPIVQSGSNLQVTPQLLQTQVYTERTTDFTLALTDRNRDQHVNSASPVVCTIPANATVAFAVGDRIDFIRLGTGAATIDAVAGVTLNGVDGDSIDIDSRYVWVRLKKVGTDAWQCSLVEGRTYTPTAHTHPLSDLTQSGATTGQVATWNGTAWAPDDAAGGAPGGSSGQLQYNNSGAFGGVAGTSWASNQLLITAQDAATTPLAVRAAASHSANIQEWHNSSGTTRLRVDANGNVFGQGILQAADSLRVGSAFLAGGDSVRAASYSCYGITGGIANSAYDVSWCRIGAALFGIRGSSTSAGAAISLIEQTAPSAPAANGVYIYAEDNGSGKTRLMALFASGAAQQIAIEP